MHEAKVCRAFFLSFSFGIARNFGFGTILSAGFLEYLSKNFGLRLQTDAFDALVSKSRFSLQGLACREQKLTTIFKSPLPLPHILQQHWVWRVSLDRAQAIGHPGRDLLPRSM